jgi:hypothetical protein
MMAEGDAEPGAHPERSAQISRGKDEGGREVQLLSDGSNECLLRIQLHAHLAHKDRQSMSAGGRQNKEESAVD